MKKLLTLIIIVALGAGLWYLFHRTTSVVTPVQVSLPSSTPTVHPDPSNATFSFEDSSVTLSKGKSEDIIAGSPAIQETTLTDVLGYGDLNADGKEDVAGLIVQTGGGSGEFLYLVAYVSGPVSYKGTNAVFIGDRIQPISINISKGVITVNYLDRSPSESFADAPTMKASKQFVVLNGTLQAK